MTDRVEEQPQAERCARTIDYDSFGLRIPCDNDLPCVKHPASDADNIADLQSRLTAAMELLARCDRVRVQGQPVLPLALREEIAALSNTKKEEA